jgi:CopG family nickel-responsive transcriptional regulator
VWRLYWPIDISFEGSYGVYGYLDEDNCLEIIAIRGPTNDVRDLTAALQTQKGVKQLKLTIITP